MRAKVILLEKSKGNMKRVLRGNSRTITSMLLAALIVYLHETRQPDTSDQEIAETVRDLILAGLQHTREVGK